MARAISKQDKIVFIVAGLIFLCAAIWMIYFVPLSHDELSPYHVIACATHPVSHYHVLREPCNNFYDVVTPFGFVYKHAFAYLGGLSSFLYAPIHHYFPNMHAPLFYGLFVYVLFCALLSRLTAKPWMSFFLFLPFFPALYQFVHDTGPIKFASLVFVLTPLMYRWAIGRGMGAQIGAGVVLGLLFALAFEDKPFWLYLMVPLFFFAIAAVTDHYRQLLTYFQQRKWHKKIDARAIAPMFVGVLGIVAILGILFVGFQKVHDTYSWTGELVYYFQLIFFVPRTFSWAQIGEFVSLYSLVWPIFAQRIYDLMSFNMELGKVPGDPYYAIYLIAIPTLMFYIYTYRAYRRAAPLAGCAPVRVLLLLCSAGSFLILSATHTMWAGHHYIFAYFPLMLLFAEIVAHVKKPTRYKLIAGYLALNILSVASLMPLDPMAHAAWERNRIIDYFNKPEMVKSSIANYTSDGNYYEHSLYAARDGLVTYVNVWDWPSARMLRWVSNKTHRRIYNICNRDQLCTAFAMEKRAGSHGMKFDEVDLGLKQWRVFRERTAP